MKYLKYFESNSFFEEIKAPDEGLDIGLEFSKKEIGDVSKYVDEFVRRGDVRWCKGGSTVIRFYMRGMEYLIFKRKDEYYIIWQRRDSLRDQFQKFYKCDQMDGIIKCLDAIS